MTLVDFGRSPDFLTEAFHTGTADLQVVSSSSTEVVLRNPDTGAVSILTGSGLSAGTAGGEPFVTGTLTGVEFRVRDGVDDVQTALLGGVSWNAAAFVLAVRDVVESDDPARLEALLSLQPVAYDARDAVAGVGFGFPGVTSDSTLSGSDFNDTLRGGRGDDTLRGGDGDDRIRLGANTGDDLIDAGTGFDTISFHYGIGDSRDSSYTLSHRSLEDRTGIVATVFGSEVLIDKGSFGETLLLGVTTTIYEGGLFIEGTALDDLFGIARGFEPIPGFIGLTPGRGSDTVQAEGSWHLGLDFGTDSNGIAATQGAVVDLVTGIVANDGFGFADTLSFGTGIYVSVTLTESADTLVALTRSGTLRGGGGTDTLDYGKGDRRVDADLGAGRAVVGGVTIQTIESFENLIGTRYDDRLLGTTGANVIEGFGGGDTIYGDGFRAGYAPTEAAQVYRLYQAALDRAPDAVEQNELTRLVSAAGAYEPLRVAAEDLSKSTEFQSIYGALDSTAFVTLLYQNVLDRAPDAAGHRSWLDWIQRDGASRTEVLLGFSESPEFVKKSPVDGREFADAKWTDDVFRLYQATLDRAPDAAGFMDWTGQLGGGTRFLTVVEGFTGSAEFQRTYGALDDTAFVTLLYENVLDRAPDAGGLADWLGRLAGGATRAEVVAGFSQSREFVKATADAVVTFVRGLEGGDTIEGGAGDNRIWGGILADEFIFDADQPAHHQVNDFEAWDYLTFRDFGYDDAGDVRAHMAQSLANVVFQDQGVTVTLVNTQLAAITDDNFHFA